MSLFLALTRLTSYEEKYTRMVGWMLLKGKMCLFVAN